LQAACASRNAASVLVLGPGVRFIHNPRGFARALPRKPRRYEASLASD
jgi:hypothetical protein